MAFKTTLVVFLLVASSVTLIPLVAQAQVPNNLLPALLSLFRIQGTVFCTLNGNVNVGGTLATPVFPNATVKLFCGAGNSTIASVTTNLAGNYSVLLDPMHFVLTQVLSSCRVAVTTPLANCNVTLSPTGTLTSILQSVGTITSGPLSIINVNAVGFSLTP